MRDRIIVGKITPRLKRLIRSQGALELSDCASERNPMVPQWGVLRCQENMSGTAVQREILGTLASGRSGAKQ
jgi:hypothetical protein